jgi:hypothetical protein
MLWLALALAQICPVQSLIVDLPGVEEIKKRNHLLQSNWPTSPDCDQTGRGPPQSIYHIKVSNHHRAFLEI